MSQTAIHMGLVGYPLAHSFSKLYFEQVFAKKRLIGEYKVYELMQIAEIEPLLKNPAIIALNVTSPYKEQVLPYLDELEETANVIGAVNLIVIQHSSLYPKGYLAKGYNTDWIGFLRSIQPMLLPTDCSAFILGSGGAARAVQYALNRLQIGSCIISRNAERGRLASELTEHDVREVDIIINATPCGMLPNKDTEPQFPYGWLGSRQLMYDLIYNPETTLFLQHGRRLGSRTKNGLDMLQYQAEEAWNIIVKSYSFKRKPYNI